MNLTLKHFSGQYVWIQIPAGIQVTGYTIAQLFNALQTDVTTLQSYHTRLISQTNNNPAGVNIIFSFYGY